MKVLIVAFCFIFLEISARPSDSSTLDSESDDECQYEKDDWEIDEDFIDFTLLSIANSGLDPDIFDPIIVCNYKSWDFYKECLKHINIISTCRKEKEEYLNTCLDNHMTTYSPDEEIWSEK